jgi:hypothetical protein
MRRRLEHSLSGESLAEPSAELADESPLAATLWELGWGLAALLAVSIWMDQQSAPLQLAMETARRKSPGNTGVARLSDSELRVRRRWLASITKAYDALSAPIRWSDVLSHLANALPEDAQLLQFRASNPLPATMDRDQIYTVLLTASGSQLLQERLHADTYWIRMFDPGQLRELQDGTYQLTTARAKRKGGAP